jgi:hypothetical protein
MGVLGVARGSRLVARGSRLQEVGTNPAELLGMSIKTYRDLDAWQAGMDVVSRRRAVWLNRASHSAHMRKSKLALKSQGIAPFISRAGQVLNGLLRSLAAKSR